VEHGDTTISPKQEDSARCLCWAIQTIRIVMKMMRAGRLPVNKQTRRPAWPIRSRISGEGFARHLYGYGHGASSYLAAGVAKARCGADMARWDAMGGAESRGDAGRASCTERALNGIL